jgi:hypothetical protein
MERIMKPFSFWHGVVFALAAGVTGSISFYALSFLLSEDGVIRCLISTLTLAYLLYLLSKSKERTGRITVLFTWCLLCATLWFFGLPISLFFIVHALAIWLVRALYFHTGLFSTLADLGLNAFSIAAAIWACHHSGSVFLSIWCFFLAQALFVAIPAVADKSSKSGQTGNAVNETEFKRAYQAAETAARKLSTFN